MQKSLLLLLTITLTTLLQKCVIPTYVGKSSLTETNKKLVDKNISRLLIVGAGSTASHLFLDNLSDQLIKLLAQKKIQCSFTYMGKIAKHTHLDLNKIVTDQYDSYLVLNPMDTSYADLHKQVAIYATPIGGGYGATGSIMGTQYKEGYYVELYTNDKNEFEEIWQGELKVDFDFTQPRIYQKVAQSLFNIVVNK